MSVISGFSDRELVIKLQRGDHISFRKIFDRYQKKLLIYTVSIVKSDGAGKDIVQETFIRLWTNRKKLDPDQSLSGYLHTIARNLSLNHLKRAGYDQELKKQVWEKIKIRQEQNSTEENLFAEESKHLIQVVVDRLPPQRQLIFQLSREKGMTHKEIAKKLGISKNTVKNQMVSSLKEIRTYLMRHADVAISRLVVVFTFIMSF